MEVLATEVDHNFGGRDFDKAILDYCIDVFRGQQDIDISTNPRAKYRLIRVCETAKRVLSSALQTDIEAETLADGEDFVTCLSRSKFEQICSHLFEKIMPLV